MEMGCTPMGAETGDPRVRRLDPRSAVEALVVTLTGAGSSGSGGDVGEGQSGIPPRDPTSGKAPAVEEGIPSEAHVERVEFVRPVGHEPITSSDLA